MAVPKLRFKEFDADYTNTTFEKLKGFSIQSGKSEEKGDTGEFPFYGSTGVIGYKDIFDYEGKSILIARVGANAGSLYQIDGKYSVSDNTLRLTVSDDTSLDYLRELLIKFNLNRLVFGTGQPLVTGGMIKKVNIFIPEFTEQTKIASFLSNVDEKISQLTQKHELLNQYKQGMMQKLFSQEIRFKADDGSEFGAWEETILSDIVNLFHGYQFRTSDFTSKGIAVIKIGNVIGNNLDLANLTYINENRREDFKKFEIQNGDILMSLTGYIGRIIEVKNKPFILLQNYRVGKFIPLNENLLIKPFLKYLLTSDLVFGRFSQLANQSAQANFGKQDMDKITVFYPSVSEQTKIANFLSAIDQKIEVVAQQIEQAKQWKKGLLQQMFV